MDRARPLPVGPLVRTREGDVAGIAEGERLLPGRPLRVPEGARVTLDFTKGARVVLMGPVLVSAAADALDGLLVKEGLLTIDLPPAAPTPSSGFWFASASARVDLVRGGRLAVKVFPSGDTVAVLVSGSASLSAAASEEPLRRKDALFLPGELVRLSPRARPVRSQGGGLTLEQALAKVQSTRPRGNAKVDAAYLERVVAEHVASLRAAVAEERLLVEAHRARMRVPDGGAMAAQTKLAAHAEELADKRRALRILLQQRTAAQLDSAASDADASSDAELEAELKTLLGRPP